jgi:hypothetical protein
MKQSERLPERFSEGEYLHLTRSCEEKIAIENVPNTSNLALLLFEIKFLPVEEGD